MHGHSIGSYVAFDPTGRDLNECLQVGRVLAVVWDTDTDDGTPDGYPRPLLRVLPNGESEPYAVTSVRSVLWAPMSPDEIPPHAIANARTPSELVSEATIVLRGINPPMRLDYLREYLGGFANTVGAADWDLHGEDITATA